MQQHPILPPLPFVKSCMRLDGLGYVIVHIREEGIARNPLNILDGIQIIVFLPVTVGIPAYEPNSFGRVLQTKNDLEKSIRDENLVGTDGFMLAFEEDGATYNIYITVFLGPIAALHLYLVP